MLHGGQASPWPMVWLEEPNERVTSYVWRRFQVWLSSASIGPVLYRKVSGSSTSVVKRNR